MTGKDGGADLRPIEPSPVVVLVRPQLADNIGAVARCMANGGLFHLRLVAPRDGWPQDRAWRVASGADRILDAATVHGTVGEAVADLHRVFATCPRPRHVVKPLLTARAAATEVRAVGARGLRAGILFGPERAGLDNEDMAQADTLVRYPLNPAFDSLNLAQAVMVMAYEWWTAGDATPAVQMQTHGTRVATKGELEQLLVHLVDQLDACGFLRNAPKRPGMVQNIRHLFTRGEATEQEVRTLHGMVAGLALGRRRLGRFEDELVRAGASAGFVELAGEAPGHEPADEGGGGAADADGDEAERLAVDGEVHPDAQEKAADEAARGAGGDAEPDDFAFGDHAADRGDARAV